ncbi:hypothetical protein FIU87_00070 [Bacillus sp. THAF10]|uniref:YaaC family protein n=1 Tax=Bacillus sp. THAF10 TaxID=2587848 RepID=UPI001267CCB6|nr:YaaC family protein [Bacillus sp. THAF10]QFT87081.1 hypothetical protein FIU87_00070 [Bacillus sp. THAF10]
MTTPYLQLFYPFCSADTAQRLLKKSYQHQNIELAEQKSYNNAYSFIYYIEHGLAYLQQASLTPTSIKPVLLFYGMVQLIKACLLTVDPAYPESTSVLAHGVSTRKRKKQSYEFIQDEVKIQKNGLYSHFSDKMFHVKQTEGTKYTMKELLFSIPELETTIKTTKNRSPFYQIGNLHTPFLKVPVSILDDYKMTQSRFVQYFQQQTGYELKESDSELLTFECKEDLANSLSFSPLLFHHQSQNLYIPRKKEVLTPFPELLVHYLLLYNLSMICRYETDWWSELLHTFHSSDLALIHDFLDVTSSKIPFYIHRYLVHVFGLGGVE